MTLKKSTAAIIDVGSNTIKLLVVQSGPELNILEEATLDARISQRIGGDTPRLGQKGITVGTEAVHALAEKAYRHKPDMVMATATSTVREAANGQDFIQAVKEKTNLSLRILSGGEEARYIALGATQDPALEGLKNFQMVDLGGGSLELIDVVNGHPQQTASMRLGAVRLMELHVADTQKPLSTDTVVRIEKTVQKEISDSGFRFTRGETPFIGSGGAFSFARYLLAQKKGLKLEDYPNRLLVNELRILCNELCAMSLQERLTFPGLPASRADIIPVALLTLLKLAEIAQKDSFLHTLYNLRFGLAAEFFAKLSPQS